MATLSPDDPHNASNSSLHVPHAAAGIRLQALALTAGETATFHARAGTTLHVASGCLALREPPLWLAERLHWPARSVSAGMAVTLSRSGWYQMLAQSGAGQSAAPCDVMVDVLPPPAWWFPVRRLARILAAWRRRRARIRPIHRSHKESVS